MNLGNASLGYVNHEVINLAIFNSSWCSPRQILVNMVRRVGMNYGGRMGCGLAGHFRVSVACPFLWFIAEEIEWTKEGREGEGCCCLRLSSRRRRFEMEGEGNGEVRGWWDKKRFFPRTKEEEDSLQIIKSLYRYLPYTINHFVHDRVETLRCTTLREHQSLWRIKHRDKAL